jgi:SagB-type dehydrogenase family enzyme
VNVSVDIGSVPSLQGAAALIDYARRVYRRGDGRDEVVAPGFEPDWDDHPAMFAQYDEAGAIELAGANGLIDRYAGLRAAGARDGASLKGASLNGAMLSTLLYLVAAPLRRKLELSWNNKQPPSGFTQQEYRRGSASGGGLYPTQIYVVSGGDPLPCGIYRYVPGHHRLIPLRRGDHRPAMAAATAREATETSQCYLVLTSDLWQNCFKYNNFGYHVCTQDVGAMLAMIRLVLRAFGVDQQVCLRFADVAVNAVLGAPRDQEVALAVVGLGPNEAVASGEPTVSASVARPRQRSQRPCIPATVLALHEAALLDARQVPIAGILRPGMADAEGEPFDLAVIDRLPEVLLKRRSAWGSMRSAAPLPAAQLKALLGFMTRHGGAANAVADDPVPAGSVELLLQSLNVQELATGGYRWDPDEARCEAISQSSPRAWQSTYGMLNYNLDEAVCLVFVTGDLDKMIERHGERGYRVLNARIGMMAQLAYSAAAALSLDCGIVLGMRAQRVKQLLELPPSRDVMLAIYLGGSTATSESFDFNFLRQGRA